MKRKRRCESIRGGWISAAAYARTGYGIQTKEILTRMLEHGFDMYNIGGIGGQTVWGGKVDLPTKTHLNRQKKKVIDIEIPILPTYGQLGGGDVAQIFIDKYGLDFIITLWDSFVIHYIGSLSVPAIPYLPVDTTFTQNMYINVQDAYKIIAFSEFGREELLKWFPPSKISRIPHGIDTKVCRPHKEQENAETRKQLKLPSNSFVLFTVGANVGERKQMPFMMLVFKELLKKYDDIYWYLFTNMSVPYPSGYDLRTYAHMLGITDHLRYPMIDPIIEPYTNEHMSRLYSMSDAYWSLTLGEGFGLPTLEAMACGVPPIITDCSTSPELVGDHGWLVKQNDDYRFVPVWIPTLQDYPVASMKSSIECIEDAYHNPDKTKKFGRASREFSLKYDWDRIMPLWFKFLRELEEELEFNQEFKKVDVPKK